jgi:hypothetical protein
MPRERLPNRRDQTTDSIRWPEGGRRVFVSAGFARDGRLLETFLRGGGRSGSDTDFLLDDLAVVLSRALQYGDTITNIACGLGRAPGGEASSLVGAVVDKLLELESAHQAEIGAESAKETVKP